ncbi:MAG: HlyD family efflux transporter periplasmic adaptor subunit [Acetobacteraceae bacterium]|nr:HlyD family efflux transporter periplasmic adaptor subunit [Acetobacteraceae bacterium]
MTTSSALFRQEALDFQRSQRQWGEVALLQPLSTKLLSWSAATAFAAVLAFASVTQYARKETVPGYLVPTAGTAKIFATNPGVVTEVYVREGEEVRQGQPLLTISTAQIAADGQDVNATMLAALALQRTVLLQQIAAEEQRSASERDRLDAQARNLESEIPQLVAQIAAQNERIRLNEALVFSASQLFAKGYISDMEYKRRQDGVLEQRQNLNSLNRQLSDLQSKLTEARSTLEQLPTATAEKIQPLRNELSTAEQRIAEIQGRRAYVLRAPITGRVSMLQATLGQVADPRRLQLEIVPADAILQAELFVPTRAAGFIKPGQEVRVLYDAFPYQKFGTYKAHVTRVSRTILTAADTAAPVPIKEPAYRVTAGLERPDIEAHGETIPLQAGMQLRADIILDRSRLMSWLIAPLLDARR